MNQLERLKQHSIVVADTGNFLELQKYAPQDATTNPSLILKAVKDPSYVHVLESVVKAQSGKTHGDVVDAILVRFGCEILKIVPGRVSTEVDARLSFDTQASIEKGRHLISLYEAAGVDRERVLIKLASTWEGIQAARQLEREGIHCNLTLLFSFCQAVACADARVRLISPFVGRIYDWYKAKAGSSWNKAENAGVNDPGVRSVAYIYHHYKRFGIETEVMGASFRNVSQILALAGCDLLTISPDLLGKLRESSEPFVPALSQDGPALEPEQPAECTEAHFRFLLNEDAMATEKLSDGIRAFVRDAVALDQLVDKMCSA